MNFDPTDILVIVLLVVLGISVLVAVVVIAKTFANDAKEAKAKAAKLETEEKRIPHEPQIPSQAPAKSKSKVKATPKPKAKAKPAPAKTHKDDVSEDDDLVAAAEVYLTYELKEQAIITLSKHLLKHPNDKKALALLKKAEASK